MKAIILAAGAASRMAYKALLPMKNLQPVIFSAINYANGYVREQDITVIVSPGPLQKIISASYPGVKFIVETEKLGVLGAIAALPRGQYMILCCDNIYPDDENLDLWTGVYLRRVYGKKHGLIVWDEERKFYTREEIDSNVVLSTPWVFDSLDIVAAKEWIANGGSPDDVVGFFNEHKPPQTYIGPYGIWCDIGTPESYQEYWDAH